MKQIKYFFQFILIILFFLIFRLIGPQYSSNISGKIFEIIGPLFRSKKVIESNIKKAFSNIDIYNLKKFKKLMWNNYGRIFAEYIFIKHFRIGKLASKIEIEGQDILNEIKKTNKQVVFISGHFSNFELMAMHLERSGINLCAVYRPLNNIFLNKVMEYIRKKYICKNQIRKGIGGMKKLVGLKKKSFSTALMIDQRVSEGILSNFFNHKALTTTIPAQLVKKFNVPVVPVHIKRLKDINFKITVDKPIYFSEDSSIDDITQKLNHLIEKMIIQAPEQWIWSHNRWK